MDENHVRKMPKAPGPDGARSRVPKVLPPKHVQADRRPMLGPGSSSLPGPLSSLHGIKVACWSSAIQNWLCYATEYYYSPYSDSTFCHSGITEGLLECGF